MAVVLDSHSRSNVLLLDLLSKDRSRSTWYFRSKRLGIFKFCRLDLYIYIYKY